MNKLKFFLLLGRPGCGKSYLYKNVFIPAFKKKGILKMERIDDFPVLQKLLDRDTKFKRHVRRDGGFQVTDWSIVDDVLKEMDKILRTKEQESKIVMLEFARDNYSKALKNFSDYVRLRSLLIYIWAPFNTCMESNRERFRNKKNVDDHIVPEALMKTYYRTDDLDLIYRENADDIPNEFSGWELNIFDNSNRNMSPERKIDIFLESIRGYRL